MNKRLFTKLCDKRLLERGNKMMQDLYSTNAYSIRQFSKSEAAAKGSYRFLANDRVTEDDIVSNLSTNCKDVCMGKTVLCIQDTSEIYLGNHRNRIKRDGYLGITNSSNQQSLEFMIHPSFVIDAETMVPYGFSHIKIWNRDLVKKDKAIHKIDSMPIEEKESYKWIETSEKTKDLLKDSVKNIIYQSHYKFQ